MMDRSDIVTSGRMAGQVRRYHTWPTLRQQTNAEHTWQVLRIYMEMFGPPSPAVTVTIMTHDMGEIATGDLPFPVKRNNPEIAQATQRIEEQAVAAMMTSQMAQVSMACVRGDPAVVTDVTLRSMIKICDLTEMLEFGMDERIMGNRYAEPIVHDVGAALDTLVETLDPATRLGAETYLEAAYTRYNRMMSTK